MGKGINILFLIIITTSCFLGCTVIPKGYFPASSKENEMIYQRYDEFKQQSFYRHKAFFKESPIEVYIGYKSEKYYRIKFIYEGSDWIFFESATIVNADGESLRFSFQSFDKITNVMSNGFVFESIDEPLSEDRVKKLLKIIEGNSRYVKVRLSGMYYKDYTLNEKHIKGLLEILNYKSF